MQREGEKSDCAQHLCPLSGRGPKGPGLPGPLVFPQAFLDSCCRQARPAFFGPQGVPGRAAGLYPCHLCWSWVWGPYLWPTEIQFQAFGGLVAVFPGDPGTALWLADRPLRPGWVGLPFNPCLQQCLRWERARPSGSEELACCAGLLCAGSSLCIPMPVIAFVSPDLPWQGNGTLSPPPFYRVIKWEPQEV